MYEDVIDDLVKQLGSAKGLEAARIRMRLKEIKKLQSNHAPT